MNRHWGLFSDTRADPVGALDAFRPDAALPDAPVLELLDSRSIAPHVDDHAVARGEEERVSHLADRGKEPVVLLGGDGDQFVDRRATDAQLLRAKDRRRLPAAPLDVIALRAPLPGATQRLNVGQVIRPPPGNKTHARHKTCGAWHHCPL